MKLMMLSLLTVSAAPVSAQIYADVTTTLGDFSIELYHEDSPKAVANLITLAEGTRAWIDSTTGAVRKNTPYYNGIIFHRVIDNFMNQAGSPNGTGSDGPGYNFPDEVGNGLVHDEPYLLSAANSGPNTNGSQFFTTVVPTPWLDGIHTVYGKIVTGTETLDLINDTPVSGSTPVTPVVINSMTIRRVGEEALAFDEFAQDLPTVREVAVSVVPPVGEEGAKLSLQQPPGSLLRVAASRDLVSWSMLSRQIDATGEAGGEFPVERFFARDFFHPSLVEWPSEAAFPDSFRGRTVTIPATLTEIVAGIPRRTAGVFTLTLTDPGTVVFAVEGQPDTVGNIDYARSFFDHDGYGATMVIYTNPQTLVPLRFRLGADLPITNAPSGRVTGTAFATNQLSISGTFSVSP